MTSPLKGAISLKLSNFIHKNQLLWSNNIHVENFNLKFQENGSKW